MSACVCTSTCASEIASPTSRLVSRFFLSSSPRSLLGFGVYNFRDIRARIDREIDRSAASRPRSEKRSSIVKHYSSQSRHTAYISTILYYILCYLFFFFFSQTRFSSIVVTFRSLFLFVFSSCVYLPLKVAGGCTARLPSKFDDLTSYPRWSTSLIAIWTCPSTLLARDRTRWIAVDRVQSLYADPEDHTAAHLRDLVISLFAKRHARDRSIATGTFTTASVFDVRSLTREFLAIAFSYESSSERHREHVHARTRRILSTIIRRSRHLRQRSRSINYKSLTRWCDAVLHRQHLISQPIS